MRGCIAQADTQISQKVSEESPSESSHTSDGTAVVVRLCQFF